MPIDFQNYRTDDVDRNLQRIGIPCLDIAVVGITGAGKSTTLNAFFQKPVAKEGNGVDPETMMIDSYFLNKRFRIWDTPGLGDSPSQDQNHINAIISLLLRTYQASYGLIDMVLVILDGSSRDMGGAYHLLNKVLIPYIPAERILVLINQADFAMKTTQHWNFENQTPDATLKAFLEDKADSIQRRVKEATGLDILRPVYYSAKYGYHVTDVFNFIIDHMPTQKRVASEIPMTPPRPSGLHDEITVKRMLARYYAQRDCGMCSMRRKSVCNKCVFTKDGNMSLGGRTFICKKCGKTFHKIIMTPEEVELTFNPVCYTCRILEFFK